MIDVVLKWLCGYLCFQYYSSSGKMWPNCLDICFTLIPFLGRSWRISNWKNMRPPPLHKSYQDSCSGNGRSNGDGHSQSEVRYWQSARGNGHHLTLLPRQGSRTPRRRKKSSEKTKRVRRDSRERPGSRSVKSDCRWCGVVGWNDTNK